MFDNPSINFKVDLDLHKDITRALELGDLHVYIYKFCYVRVVDETTNYRNGSNS